MSASLAERLRSLIRDVLDSYPGAWLAWCDPQGQWAPLLERAAALDNGFALLSITERTAGSLGSPLARRQLQERLERHESLVLRVTAGPADLGWLWAQTLLAERTYSRSLREQLLEWGWRPPSLSFSDAELAELARRQADRDPAEWGGGGLQPDVLRLLRVLASVAEPAAEDKLLLDTTAAQMGLPPLDWDDVPAWQRRALACLLVTQAHHAVPGVVSERHELLIPAAQRDTALRLLLERWSDSVALRPRLAAAILEADPLIGLAQAPLTAGVFLSRAAEAAVFASVCSNLARHGGRELLEALAAQQPQLTEHAAGFWGDAAPDGQGIAWAELARLSQAAEQALQAMPGREWAAVTEATTWFVQSGWQLDAAGEEILRTLSRPTPELLALVGPLRDAYRARWEELLIRWSQTWMAADCPELPYPPAGRWLKALLERDAGRATAILVIDALRYDLGATLAAQINAAEGATRATVQPARAPLPSITALGMGMALPVPSETLRADVVDGAWRLRQVGDERNLSDAAQRRAFWQQHGVAAGHFLTMAQVEAGEAPAPGKRPRLVIHDALIDKLGHDDELEGLGPRAALNRYVRAISQLRDKGWRRILIVTDHGFIHTVTASETNSSPPVPNPSYASRRALAYPAAITWDGPQALAPGGAWRVAVPSGAASFRAYGGLGYFHGGASLQEWLIPCICVEWPSKSKPTDVALQPLPSVLSLRPQVTLSVVRTNLLLEDTISRTVEVLIREPSRQTILFRSGPVVITPDQEDVAIPLAVVPNVMAERGTPLRIEVRDSSTEAVLNGIDSILMVPLEDW
ncbi:MAG: PglZ domain-containing protein [Chloroflexi bacterium]|nr:PglZ domain-containing protein [Chloroflexota bacterium]